jgi:pyruvate dehydrogenase E1 component alpha subunit
MHLVGVHVGLLPTFAIVGAGLPIATGAGFASMMQGSDRVAVALFGDGATNIGAFHESLNLAAVWKLPVLFLCENNLYGEYSRIQTTTPVDDIASRASGYAMKSEVVDGQDIDALISVLGRRIAEIRAESEPVLVEAKTYRYSGHSRSDAGSYRPPGELDRWLERDPIKLAVTALLDGGHASKDQIDELWSQAAQTIKEAREFALASPEPSTESMFASVYAPQPS